MLPRDCTLHRPRQEGVVEIRFKDGEVWELDESGTGQKSLHELELLADKLAQKALLAGNPAKMVVALEENVAHLVDALGDCDKALLLCEALVLITSKHAQRKRRKKQK